MRIIQKPEANEHAPYVGMMYIEAVPNDGLILQHLRDNLQTACDLVRSFTEEQAVQPCADGEWTIKEILLHVIDDERIYAYRALRFARNDSTELPGFEQDDYIEPSAANQRSIESLLSELTSVRMATLTLFENLPEGTLLRGGVASGSYMSVRAIAYHIAGHELHHIESIKENYASRL